MGATGWRGAVRAHGALLGGHHRVGVHRMGAPGQDATFAPDYQRAGLVSGGASRWRS